jgi:hypothetical protein
LRTYLTEADLAEVNSALGDEGYAFAMVVRGQLVGALVSGKRANDEGYDPAERALLRGVARELAAALQVLHSADRVDLVTALADGSIDLRAAELRAKRLT